MGGKSSKSQITRYHMSQWWGLAIKLDAVLAVEYGEKEIWSGRIEESQTISISKPNLYGGDKKEGGVEGRMTVLMGDDQQVLPDGLAKRLGVTSGADVPGARGLTSLFFTGTGGGTVAGYNGKPMVGPSYSALRTPGVGPEPWINAVFGPAQAANAFYWTANSPYLKQLAATVERIPRQLDPATAVIPRGAVSFVYDGVWKYRVVEPADGGAQGVPAAYISPSYDDSAWDEGPGAFGSGGPAGSSLSVGTFVPSGVVGRAIWIRKKLSLAEPRKVGDISVTVFHDDGGWLWWNGAPIAITPTANYFEGHAVIPNELVLEENTAVVQVLDAIPSGSASNIFAGLQMSGASVANDANPAHIIYECLTDQTWGLGEDPANIDVESFQDAAQVLFQEMFGLSLIWDAASAIEDFVNNILAHINGVVFNDPATGLLKLKLVRNDFDVSTLREVNPDNATLTRFSRKAWGDTINEIQVSWTDPADEEPSKVVLQDDGNIAQQGSINSSNSDYPGVRRPELAWQLAERDLRAASAPLATGEASGDRRFYDVTPMEVVKLRWPDYGVESLYARIASVTYGAVGDSSITMALSEDVFSYPLAKYTGNQSTTWTPPSPGGLDVTGTLIMPAPYYGLAAALGVDTPDLSAPTVYATVLATSDAGVAATYDLYTEAVAANGSTEYQVLDSDRPYMAAEEIAVDLAGASVSTIAGLGAAANDILIIGGGGPAQDQELALVASVDGSGVATVWRGILDTTPKAWPAGANVWVGALDYLTPDTTARVEGATAEYKVLPSAADGGLSTAPVISAAVPARARFPYAPAKVMVGALDAFSVTSAAGAFTVTWAHRNKATQAEQILRQDEGSVTPEPDIRYGLAVLDGAGATLVSRTDIAGDTATVDLAYTGAVTLQLWAIDDVGPSYQKQVRTLNYTAGSATENTITAPTYVPPDNSTIIDGGDLDG